ncbi:hypothetical protein BKA70DRAFT_1431183 [Coprinopsis sp. MPI-PUGE-AT-0042]|nr:hypothetical protein BKA70DRAFT_1431183 [Coprinopsis sp. MPI-PUGE-AT-0042]
MPTRGIIATPPNEDCPDYSVKQKSAGKGENVADNFDAGSPMEGTSLALDMPLLRASDATPPSPTNDPTPRIDLEAPISRRKAARNRKTPSRYRDDAGLPSDIEDNDIHPEPLAAVESQQGSLTRSEFVTSEETGSLAEEQSEDGAVSSPSPRTRIARWWNSKRNKFSLWRRYLATEPPTHDPEQYLIIDDFDDSHPADIPPPSTSQLCSTLELPGSRPDPEFGPPGQGETQSKTYGPFSNSSSLLFANWYWNRGNEKSLGELDSLLNDVFKSPDFVLEDVLSTDWKKVRSALSCEEEENEGQWFDDAGWTSTPVVIPVPFHKAQRNSGTEYHNVGNLQHRRIVSVIEEKIRNTKDAKWFHYQPYELYWDDDDSSPNVRVQGELYNSPAFIEAHKKVQELPSITGCHLERVVVALMFWSDETLLTSFGSAKLWPCYMFFGNESKYRRGKTSLKLCEHIAYLEKLSDDFQDYLRGRNNGKLPPKEFMAHCAREIFHAQWRIILDDALLEAMENGIVIMCQDGIERRFFPRIFTYSADYPERTRIACVKQNGRHPCTTCLIDKSHVHNMGTEEDMAFRTDNPRLNDDENREMIRKALQTVDNGYAVTGKTVMYHLQDRSLLPINNVFSSRLGKFDFNIYKSLVVDPLHEVEIGVWRSLFQHLLRLLNAEGKSGCVAELNQRYRDVPSFGRDTIRRFSSNASGMKRKAARDFEDLLQCSIPVFESLLPSPHNEIVVELLYRLCEWHALAKLRLHHDLTLDLLDEATIALGSQFRRFQVETCNQIATFELPDEAEARARRTLRTSAKRPSTGRSQKPAGSTSRRPKNFSLSTPKYHALGHYSSQIRHFGTVDSFTSEIGETNHPAVKTWYKRTDRRKYSSQIAGVERQRARLRNLMAQYNADDNNSEEKASEEEDEEIPGLSGPNESLHCVGGGSNQFYNLSTDFGVDPAGLEDPAVHNFLPKLKRFLLPRIQHLLAPELYVLHDPSTLPEEEDPEWRSVDLHRDRIYFLQTMRTKYTTYDVRREQDTLRVKSESNIMVLDTRGGTTSSQRHPYRYARVLGIFHADVRFLGHLRDGRQDYATKRIDFLWVRWYHQAMGSTSAPWLKRLEFEPLNSPGAFGFLDPVEVIRAVHLIPQLSLKPQPKVHVSKWLGKKKQWRYYYVNRYADRDMYMRYHLHLAIGHCAIRKRCRKLGLATFPTGDQQRMANLFQALPVNPPRRTKVPDLQEEEDLGPSEGEDADSIDSELDSSYDDDDEQFESDDDYNYNYD